MGAATRPDGGHVGGGGGACAREPSGGPFERDSSPPPPSSLSSQNITPNTTNTTGEALELATMSALRALGSGGSAMSSSADDADELAAQPEQRSLERLLAQLRAFYSDTQPLGLPASANEPALTGAALLRLLVLNRRADFHCALERLPPALAADPAVAPAVQVERWLTEGAYNKVLEAAAEGAKAEPPPLGAAFLGRLAATVRDEVASCVEAAYASLPLAGAARLMGVSAAEAAAQAARRGWVVDGQGVVRFSSAAASGGAGDAMEADGGGEAAAAAGSGAAAAVGCREDSLAFIRNALQYAKELERIV